METGQTCRVIPSPLSHSLATQKGSHLGVPPIPSLHQAGRCCRHWSKKAPSLPCPLCTHKSLNREKPQTQVSAALFPGCPEGAIREERRPGHSCHCYWTAQHLGILLRVFPAPVQGCAMSHPHDRKQRLVFPAMSGSCRRYHTWARTQVTMHI